MMERIEADLCVIGAGSGGLSIAAGAVQMGASVVLLEGGKMGGDCLNYGCVPSKALIAAGKAAVAHRGGERLGVTSLDPTVDYGAAKDHVRAVIAGIEPHDSVERFESLGVQVITEYGEFISDYQVKAGNNVIEARRFVIATGSKAFVPPIPGIDETPYFTNEDIFDLRDRPDHLLVIGGGPIGVELAQAHRRLGSDVTIIEAERVLGNDDPEAAAIVIDKLRAEGVTILEGAKATAVSGKAGAITVVTDDGQTHAGSHLLMVAGRRASIDGIGLEKAGIETTRTGVKVNAGLKTSNRKVYAVGDAAGGLQFTHVAGYHAGIVIRSALFGLPAKAAHHHIPWATYTDPELAQVGPTEAAARAEYGDKLAVLRFDYAENDRARAELKTDGFIKVMVVKGRPVGATIVGHLAGEMITPWSLAIGSKLKIGAMAGMVAPYPTYSELNKRAAGQYYTPRLFESDFVKRFVRFVQRF